jgi:hypothetical protein
VEVVVKRKGSLLVGDQSSSVWIELQGSLTLWGCCAESLAFDLFRGATNRCYESFLAPRGRVMGLFELPRIVFAWCVRCLWYGGRLQYFTLPSVSDLELSPSRSIPNNRQPSIYL